MKKSVLDYLRELEGKIDSLNQAEVLDLVSSFDFSDDAVKQYAFLETAILPDYQYSDESLRGPLAALDKCIGVNDDWAAAA